MGQKIKVLPNQSLLDVIIQGCGTLEAGMQLSADNGLSINYMPVVNSEVIISDMSIRLGDAGNLNYLQRNGIVIGTKNTPGPDDIILSEGGDTIVSEGGGILISES